MGDDLGPGERAHLEDLSRHLAEGGAPLAQIPSTCTVPTNPATDVRFGSSVSALPDAAPQKSRRRGPVAPSQMPMIELVPF